MIVDASLTELFGVEFDGAAFATHMFDALNYSVLGAALTALQPRRVFEIGTYEGVTSQFILDHSPATVVSIAYPRGRNSLPKPGLRVTSRDRFTQLIGNSHDLTPADFLARFGRMDLVLIDGDHTYRGVKADTQLALSILAPGGVILWHDARTRKYPDVERYLRDSPLVVTREGSLACYTSSLEPAAGRGSSPGSGGP